MLAALTARPTPSGGLKPTLVRRARSCRLPTGTSALPAIPIRSTVSCTGPISAEATAEMSAVMSPSVAARPRWIACMVTRRAATARPAASRRGRRRRARRGRSCSRIGEPEVERHAQPVGDRMACRKLSPSGAAAAGAVVRGRVGTARRLPRRRLRRGTRSARPGQIRRGCRSASQEHVSRGRGRRRQPGRRRPADRRPDAGR